MRIITVNVNGIRAAARKGFFDWLPDQNADFVCLQEIKAQNDQLLDPVFRPAGFHVEYHEAQKKGYSGVGIYSRYKPDKIKAGIGWADIDSEGRFLEFCYPRFSVISLYMHSGSSSDIRQQLKFDFMGRFKTYLQAIRKSRRHVVICGDWNIAHKKIDLKNWRGNQKNSGFLPEERSWMDDLFQVQGYVDAFRHVEPGEDQYTWWSNRGRAWEKNVGWRIDYQICTPGLGKLARSAAIYKTQRFSDHAPLTLDYDFKVPTRS